MDNEKDIAASSQSINDNNMEDISQPDLLCHTYAVDSQVASKTHLDINHSLSFSNASCEHSKIQEEECAFLTNNLQSVHLTRDNPLSINLPSRRRRLIPINNKANDYDYESSSGSEFSDNTDRFLNVDLGNKSIPELTAEEELKDERNWRSCTVTGVSCDIQSYLRSLQ